MVRTREQQKNRAIRTESKRRPTDTRAPDIVTRVQELGRNAKPERLAIALALAQLCTITTEAYAADALFESRNATAASPEQELEKRERSQAEFHRVILALEDAGYTVEFSSDITNCFGELTSTDTVPAQPVSVVQTIDPLLDYLEPDGFVGYYPSDRTPLDDALRYKMMLLDVPIELRPQYNSPIVLPLYHARFKDKKNTSVVVENWLTGKELITFSLHDSSVAGKPETAHHFISFSTLKPSDRLSVRLRVQDDFTSLDTTTRLKALRQENGDRAPTEPMYSLRREEISKTVQEVMKEFSGVHVITRGDTPIDIDRPDGLFIEGERLQALEGHPIQANGTVDQLCVTRFIPKPDEADMAAKETYSMMAASPLEDSRYDSYGNLQMLYRSRVANGIQETIVIQPDISFADLFDDGRTFNPIRIDLSSQGITSDDPFLYERVERPNGDLHNHTYQLYGHSAELPLEFLSTQESIEFFANGIASVELDFGLHPGEAVKRVYVVESGHTNVAVLTNRNVETVIITDELLRDTSENPQSLQLVGVHETLHAVSVQHFFDADKGAMTDDPRWKSAFALSSSDFFNAINESTWYGTNAGHSQDNEVEFFASLLVTLYDPQWETNVQKLTPRVLYEYMFSLNSVAKVIAKRGSPGAPICKKIQLAVKKIKQKINSTRE